MLSIRGLKTENLIDPMGMDEPCPRFSFYIDGFSRGNLDFRITVRCSGRKVWDSGLRSYPDQPYIPYEGETLLPFTRYDWQVRIHENGKMQGKASAFFETGFLNTPWEHSCWITGQQHQITQNNVISLFRIFELGKKNIASARLCVAALGLYEAQVNGKNVTEDTLLPGWPDFYTRTMYQVHDVTKHLASGRNVIAFQLAEGWYSGTIVRGINHGQASYGNQPELRAELRLLFQDGTTEIIGTDKNFYAVALDESAIRMSDIYQGEICEGWRPELWRQGISSRKTAATEMHDRDPIRIHWQNIPPIRRVMELKPVRIIRRAPGTYIVDFGQNCAGRERLVLHHTVRGCAITVRHGEMLNPDGSLYTENLRTALATTHYTTGSHEIEIYEPHFTYYGFRYLEISGWPGRLTKQNVSCQVLSSGIEQTGRFSCSNPLIERFWKNTLWGQRSNFLDVPTDCPQRDERRGWAGDAQVFAEIAAWNMDCSAFFAKWDQDFCSCQREDGVFPHIVPKDYPTNVCAASGWSDAGIIIPEMLYRRYGDLRTAEKAFPGILRWLNWQWKHTGGPLLSNSLFGDWLNCAEEKIPPEFISTAYFIHTGRMALQLGGILGKTSGLSTLKKRLDSAQEAMLKQFTAPDGTLLIHTQTAAAMMIVFGIAEKDSAVFRKAGEFLERDIRKHKVHLTTGFLGTPILLEALTMTGNAELAGELLCQTDMPGWLFQVQHGATTVWERWNSWSPEEGFGNVGMNSFNHFANGSAASWLFSGICGIRPLFNFPGFRRFWIVPNFISELENAEAEFKSPYGIISSSWHRKAGKLTLKLKVPCGTEAILDLPRSFGIAENTLIPSGEWIFHE